MTPQQAILEAVAEQLALPLLLDIPSQIDVRHNDQPHAYCGDIFVGIVPGGFTDGPSPDAQMGIDQILGVRIAITQRTGYIPDDKMIRSAAMDSKRGVLSVAQRVVREMRVRRLKIPYVAGTKLSTPWDGQFLSEPLRLSSSAAEVRVVDPRHFHAEPPQGSQVHCQDYGLIVGIEYSGARYMENVLVQTQAV